MPAHLDRRFERMRYTVSAENDLAILEELPALIGQDRQRIFQSSGTVGACLRSPRASRLRSHSEEVAEGVVFSLNDEHHGIGNFGVLLDRHSAATAGC
eukprot:scaffold255085_cov28-Tisochrysis_lutea.AAC.1